jgi:hypothetical protein
MLVIATLPDSLWDTTQIKVVLPTILVTAFVTALITEPMKVAIQNRWKQRQIRKHVLAEVAFNLNVIWTIKTILLGPEFRTTEPFLKGTQVTTSGNVEVSLSVVSMRSSNILWMKSETEKLQRTAYETALKEFYLFIRIPDYDYIRKFYDQLESAQIEVGRYCTEPYDKVIESPVWFAVEIAYSLGTHTINAFFKTRAFVWKYGPEHMKVLIKPKPLRVTIRELVAEGWRRTVGAWWKRALEDYKKDYEDIKKQSGHD